MEIKMILSLTSCGILSLSAVVQKKDLVRPNIVFLLSDDHSRAAISAYGGINAKLAPTPNIDRIAYEGARFNNMICSNSISGPSRACLLTGKYSTTHGFYQNEGGICFNENQPTSTKILQENGYTTSLFGKYHLNTIPTGFDYFMIHDNPGQQGSYWNPLFNTNGIKAIHEGYETKLITDAALNWIDTIRDKSKPFCMMLHFKSPHRPWEPDEKYTTLFDDVEFPYPVTFDDTYEGRERTLGQNMATIENHLSRGDLKMTPPPGFDKKHVKKWLWFGGSGKEQFWTPDPLMSREEVKKWKFQIYMKNYLRCVHSVDDNVGRLLNYLKANNLFENTIIIYMSDQGFYLGEHGLYDKRWMYEESIQMPMLISYPKGIKAGVQLDALALNVDIAPTLLDYAGVKIPSDMHGISLRPLFEKKNAMKNWRKSIYYHYFEYPKWHCVEPHYGVRTDRYKLIHFYYNSDIWEFYDLHNDSNEMNNAINSAQYSQEITNLKREVEKLQRLYNDDITIEQRRELTKRYMIEYNE